MLTIKNVSYSYAVDAVLKSVSLDIGQGEIVCLLGPSGCGKTTLLRIIAGLETGYDGEVRIDGHDLVDIPVHQRGFGLMFQDFALFPHMTVEQNIAYGLYRKDKSRRSIASSVDDLLSRVGLLGLGKRDISSLSGGQKQRVALARSLAPNPQLLMLDEPLGSLDALLREQLIVELRKTIKSVGLTSIYVTHDQMEAYAIADRIVVMNQGQIEQIDSPADLFFKPKTEFTARFLGLSNVIKLGSDKLVDKLISISPNEFSQATAMLIHPSAIRIVEGTSTEYSYDGFVEHLIFRGLYYELTIRLSPQIIVKAYSYSQHLFEFGDMIHISIDPKFVLPLH